VVNPQSQGKKYPATEPYLVGREKIREFAKAVQSVSPLNFDVFAAQAAGYEDVIAPPTFAVFIQELALKPVLVDPEVDLDFSRVVHGDQRFVHQRPIVAGDSLTGILEIASIKTLGAHAMVTMTTDVFANGDELVCQAISTLVVRGD